MNSAGAHRHRPQLVRNSDSHAAVHGAGLAGRFNAWLEAIHEMTAEIRAGLPAT